MIELLLEAESALSLGMLDRAEILYRQVAGADPRNSIAVVGLARVTLERGDEPGALKQARRALAIDPENTAAQRMTQRLEEVLRYRGTEVVPVPSGPAPAQAKSLPPAPPEPAEAGEPADEPADEPAEPAPTTLSAASAPAPTAPPASPAPTAPPASPAPTAPPASPAPTTAPAAPHAADTDPIAQPGGPPPVPPPPSRSFVDRLFRRR